MVYWSQRELFRMARSSGLRLALFEAPAELAGFLRVNDLIIVCGAGHMTIEAAVPETCDDGRPSDG